MSDAVVGALLAALGTVGIAVLINVLTNWFGRPSWMTNWRLVGSLPWWSLAPSGARY